MIIYMKTNMKKAFFAGAFLCISINAWAVGGVHSSFVEAVRSGDIKQVEALWHPAVSVSDWNRWHLLHLAAEQGDADILNFLLERGANINELNARRYAPLHLAAWGNHEEAVLVLLLRGADVRLTMGLGLTAEGVARRQHSAVAVVFESFRGSGPNGPANPRWGNSRMTLLHYLALRGYLSSAELLLDRGANPNACDMQMNNQDSSEEITPLHLAAAAGNLGVAMLLCNYRAEVNARDVNGLTPLHYAAAQGNVDIVDCLLERAADIEAGGDVEGVGGYTPLHFAAMEGHADVVELLLRRGADYDVFTEIGQLPEALAWENEHHAVGELIRRVRAEAVVEVGEDGPAETASCPGVACLQPGEVRANPRGRYQARL